MARAPSSCEEGGGGAESMGLTPPPGAGRPSVQETSPPSCGEREHAPTFAAFARLRTSTAAKYALYACVVRRQNAFLMLPCVRVGLNLSFSV